MPRNSSFTRAVVTILLTGVLFTCRDTLPPQPTLQPSAAPAPPVTLVGAGTVASCSATGGEATAAILDTIPGTVFTTGDNVYPTASLVNFQNCYGPSWGRHKARTLPTLGNKEYETSATAADYFSYFGAAAGDPTKGYYSYTLGPWHIVVLNSLIPMSAGSAQEQWLRADLAATPQQCTLAYWHYPRFSSGTTHGSAPETQPLWQALYDAHADVVISGHEHNYERFALQTPTGGADPVNGIREFVVGTGGGSGPYPFGTPLANSEVRITGTNGVLRLTLGAGTYAWQFIPVAGKTATDAGSGSCHGSTPQPPPPPFVDAGPDQTTTPAQTVTLTIKFSDTGLNAAPWAYAITWGDGSSSNGSTTTPSPITVSHAYAALGRDSVRVTVTNNLSLTGSDSLAVQVLSSSAVVLVGAGDIADCSSSGDSLTANLLDNIPGTVFAVGDDAYPDGSSSDFANCYTPTWGRHKARTQPVPGNHEYLTANATGYYGYFGAAAGDPAKGYYSYDLGGWHIVALNGELGVSAASAQVQWLRADLAASSKRCTMAYWHEPRFVSSSGGHVSNTTYQTLWDTLYRYGAEVVVNGHEHVYERFAPQSPSAVLDPNFGIREFVAGTGGTGLAGDAPTPIANSEARNSVTWGVLKLTLDVGSYSWQFIPVVGRSFSDAGSGTCHDAPVAVNHAPIAAPGGSYSGTEGAATSFDGSGSSDPDGDALAYAWSFGDGTTGSGAKPSHTYADNGAYTVTLTVTDARGASSSGVTTTAAIANATPVVTAGANQTAGAGSPFTLNATFSDAGVNDAPWGFAVDWGDRTPLTSGSASGQASPITAVHTYAAPGSNTARVTVTDKDGGAGSATTTVTVTAANRPPTAAAGGPYTGTEGAAVSLDGSGSSDLDGDALTYAWSFGDAGTGSGVKPSHAYANNGTFTVSLTITDARGASSSPTTTTATIANAAPVVNAGPSQTASAGSPFTVTAAFSDAGVNDAPWAYAITWGDGTSQTSGSTSSQATPITATHTYAAAGTYATQITVTDRDGAPGMGSKSVTVSAAAATVTLVGAGTVASCSATGGEATAAILDTIPGTVFTTGDNVYPTASLVNFQNCYGPSWGRHKARTLPTLGNKEYETSATAADYFSYFGAAAGDPTKGYYSYTLGPWHIVVLNSLIPMSAGSAQEQWLRADLAATPQQCTLAYWHYPRFSSGTTHGSAPETQPLWQALYDAHADVVISGHEHNYERFALQTPTGGADPVNGIREFVVGTGGGSGPYPFGTPLANSEVRITGTNGVLRLTLGAGTYAWQFIPVAGKTATDAGSGSCH